MRHNKFMLYPWNSLNENNEKSVWRLQTIKDCGFNTSCFVSRELFDKCRELGLEIYYSARDRVGASHDKAFFGEGVTDEDIRALLKDALSDLPEDVRSVYINDEPGATQFPRLRMICDCVHEFAPHVEAYINLLPNYAVCGAPNLSQLETPTYEEHLERFAETVEPDLLSVDNYQVIMSNNLKGAAGKASYYNNLIQMREVCDKYDIPMQFVACSCQLRDWLTIPTYANFAIQAYTALAAGAKAIGWFVYFGLGAYLFAPVDDCTGEDIITPSWYHLRDVNRRILPLGETLFDMDYKGLYFTNTEGLDRAHSIDECTAISEFTSSEECVIGHYRDSDGSDVVLVVNGSLQASAKISLNVGGELECFNTETREWRAPLLTTARGKTSPMWLEPGCGILLRAKKG